MNKPKFNVGDKVKLKYLSKDEYNNILKNDYSDMIYGIFSYNAYLDFYKDYKNIVFKISRYQAFPLLKGKTYIYVTTNDFQTLWDFQIEKFKPLLDKLDRLEELLDE